VATTTDTVERILDGALRALARRGSKRLAMSDICEEAGVSRGTLYRYFRSKEEVLAAISEHIEQAYGSLLADAIEQEPALEDRLRVVLKTTLGYANATAPRLLLEADPSFTLQRLRGDFPFFVKVAQNALGPVLEESEVVKSGRITATAFVEIIQWISLGAHLVPSAHADQLPEILVALWESASGR
jgi:AcrR family transcriptional regulator